MPEKIDSVCIIDDDHVYINLVSKIIQLKNLSDNVIVFNNGREALDYFLTTIESSVDSEVPKIILLDLNMPIMDGWQFLEEFEKIQTKIPKNINLYVVSSSINKSDIERARSKDVVLDYLTKPLKLQDFERILV